MVLSHTNDKVTRQRKLTSLNEPLPVTNSTFQIQLGNVDGFELRDIGGANSVVGLNFEDLTPTGGSQTFPASTETWEILSTDANDTSAGTGARTVGVFSLDGDYVAQSETVSMNGTTPVTLTGSHFRTDTAIVLTADPSASNTNIGNLIIRVSGGGTERMRIPAGVGNCKSLIFTVPAGKTALGQFITLFPKKNLDFTLRTKITPLGGATILGGELSTYQTIHAFPIIAPFTLPEKTDIIVETKSENADTEVLAFVDFLIIDNDKILTAITSVRNIK